MLNISQVNNQRYLKFLYHIKISLLFLFCTYRCEPHPTGSSLKVIEGYKVSWTHPDQSTLHLSSVFKSPKAMIIRSLFLLAAILPWRV